MLVAESAATKNVVETRPTLRDIVLAILSMTAINGSERVRLTLFYAAFEQIWAAHKDKFPPMRFTKGAYSVYSKKLDDALQSLIGYSVALPNPSLQYLELKTDIAIRNLAWLRDKYPTQLDDITPLAEQFWNILTLPQKATADIDDSH